VIARGAVAFVAAILVATQVVRNAAVAALSDSKPEAASRFWSRHPETEISTTMTEIARSARERRAVPASVFEVMADAAVKDPLASEPFLVRGVQAELSGNGVIAQRSFEAAQWRDPRSLPAAYFLADRYFRLGDAPRGLRETAALVRLSPAGPKMVAPYVAAYAANPANWPTLRGLFRDNRELADAALTALAANAANAPAVLALADPGRASPQDPWLPTLLSSLTEAGKFAEARAIWAKTSKVPPTELLHDSTFTDRSSPEPFNWSLTSSTVGLAERQAGGRLHVVFYAQEDGFLASQLLVLPAGSYRLSMQLLGNAARARVLSWSVWCDKAGAPLASATLDSIAARGLVFRVSTGCAAQWIRLAGASQDISQQSDVTIGALKLEKTGA
jgi:hypothetical protein